MTNIVKVTPEMVENEIISEHYFTASEGIMGACAYNNYLLHTDDTAILEEAVTKKEESSVYLEILTICVLELKNGFTFVGVSSPIDPRAFNKELGRKYAREDAVSKIYPFLGYRLLDQA